MNLPSPSPDPRDRSVSIIISNWNYGHYVADCIDSALDQSQPADEIIVVDDGSSDGSARALSPYAERVTLVFQRNGGQAAAMNAGFARSTGAIVLFLDADDLLRPEAVETVRTNWFEGLSSLSFGLELIDADGASRGLYEQTILAAQGDNRPELLGWGSFPFAPTSGNSFSREFLRDVLPMDEARWRISADAFLIKAAALYGRMAVIRPVLGAYRTHSANNYYREHAPRNWWIQRGVIDIADALNGLAAMPRLPAASATERELLRLRLRLTSLELRARLMQASGAEPALAPRARSALAMTLLGPLAFRAKLAAALPLSALAIGAGRSRAVQHWLGDARARPAALQWISSLLGDRRLQTEMGRLRSQRYSHTVRFGERLAALSPTPLSRVLAQSWLGEIVEGRYWSAGPHAAFEFRLDATPHTARIEIDVQSGPEWRAEPLGYVAALDGRKLLATDLWDRGIIRLDLPRELRPRDGIIRLQVSCAPPTHALRPWRRRIERPPYFAIHSLRVGIVDAFPDFPFLAEGTLAPFASLLPADPLALGWRRGGDGGARMIGSEASCRVSALASDGNLELVLAQAPPNARGWLRVFCDGVEILSTDASADQELRCRLPTPRQAGARALELRFVFAMHDATEEIGFGLQAIGLYAVRQTQTVATAGKSGPPRYALLNLGRRIACDRAGNAELVLGAGWDAPDRDGVRNMALEASLAFSIPIDASDLMLQLELSSDLPDILGLRHVVGVSAAGKMLASVQLIGPATLEVPLGADCVQPNGNVAVTIHSLQVQQDPASGAPPPALARILLRALSVSGARDTAQTGIHSAPGFSYPKPPLRRLLDAIETRLAEKAPDAAHFDELAELRARLSTTLFVLDSRAVEASIAQHKLVEMIDALGVATAHFPHSPDEQAMLATLRDIKQSGSDAWLRTFLCGMLLLPACQIPLDIDLMALPEPLLWNAHPLASYLGRDPVAINGAAGTEILLAYAQRLLRGLDEVLAVAGEGTTVRKLAVGILTMMRPRKVLFGDQNLATYARLKSQCFERFLSQTGHMLAQGRRASAARARKRIGVLVRDVLPNPEGWLLLGMYRGLDRQRFELVLITLATGADSLDVEGRFDSHVSLANSSIEQSVENIRALDLDIFVLGSFFNGFERLPAIVSHRLAPTQVLCAAIAPMTSGLRSFDHVISCASSEPADAQAHYSERLLLMDGPLQCFDFQGAADDEAADAGAVRATLGIPPGAVAMLSGAMQDKIVPQLAESWARILLLAPDAVLVLYPFAPNWLQHCDEPQLTARLRRRLAEFGIAEERLIVLAPQSPAQVRQALRIADLYLDSFPYSGATTVVEALTCGAPVVTLAGSTQRGLQGASWVRAFGLDDLVASSVDEYIAKATQLASDGARRRVARDRLAQTLARHPQPHADFEGFGARFSSALLEIAEARGRVVP